MIAQSVDLARELYFAILMDRASKGPVMVASPQGGMDIEAVAHDTPHLIFKVSNAHFFFYSYFSPLSSSSLTWMKKV